MHLHSAGKNAQRDGINVCLVDVNLRIEGPERILAVLDATLSNVPRFDDQSKQEMTILVRPDDDVWEIRGAGGSRKILTAQSLLPQVAGAVVNTAVSNIATTRNLVTMRATIVQKNGRALAMIGDDWESALILATHLHGRGWSYIGTDHGVMNPSTREVFCIQKSLYVNASSVAQLPIRYRRAVEASPWYVTSRGIAFYAVDPSGIGLGPTWTPSALLNALIVVDGSIDNGAAIESIDPKYLRDERFMRLGLDLSMLPIADLRIGAFIETSDLVEHWFGSFAS